MEKENTVERVERVLNYCEKNDIEDIVFDLDGTLVDTDPYFKKEIVTGAGLLAWQLNIYGNGLGEEVYSNAVKIHKERNHPTLVDVITLSALERYVTENGLEEIYTKRKEGIEIFIKRYFKDFYKKSPQIFPNTLEAINTFSNINRRISTHSIAQVGWTEVKVKEIKKQYLCKYGTEIDIPFYATDINSKKDEIAWRYSQKNLRFDFLKSLIVGDDYYADILPSYNLGCRNLVYINRKGHIPTDMPEDIVVVKDIGDIFDHMY
mgnify:CR=1 FL=1